MSYDSKMLKFDYSFLTCRGGKKIDVAEGEEPRVQTVDEEATELCSQLGKRGYRLIRWYIREDTVKHIIMEKQYR